MMNLRLVVSFLIPVHAGCLVACSPVERDFGRSPIDDEQDDASIGGGGGVAGADGASGSDALGGSDNDIAPTCTPGSLQCGSNGYPQLCAESGTWENQAECPEGTSCEDGKCSCPSSACEDICVNLESDAMHCGSCGHDCLGGSCENGVCQPIALATGQSFPHGIAVDATHVYWANSVSSANGGSVSRVPKLGGPIETLATNQEHPQVVVTDGTNVFWSTFEVRTLPVAGGMDYSVVAVAQHRISALRLFGNQIYFSEQAISADQTSIIGRVAKSGGTVDTVTSLDTGISSFALLGDCTYFHSSSTNIMRACPTLPVTLHVANTSITSIEVDNSGIYYSASGIHRLPLAGADESEGLASGATGRLVVDGQFVYYTETLTPATMACSSDAVIQKVPKTGGDPITLAGSPQGCPFHLTVDDQAVYWTNRNGGEVMMVAK